MTQAFTPDSRIVRSSEPVAAALDDELVMLSVELGKYFTLNHIATAIWQRLGEPVTLADLCEDLAGAYEVPPERCSADVRAFVERLHARGLVRVVD